MILRDFFLFSMSSLVSADVNNVMSNMRAEAERLTYGLFEEETSVSRSVSMLPSVATSTADSGFIAMIRTGRSLILKRNYYRIRSRNFFLQVFWPYNYCPGILR